MLGINSSGVINIADTYHDPDDSYTFTGKLNSMQIFFQEISVDFKKHKKLTVAINLGVEYANGETIILKRKFVASLKKTWIENSNHIKYWFLRLFPTA